MRRFLLGGLAAVAATVAVADRAPALRIALPAPMSTKAKTMQAEAVVVGKVTGIDKETVDLEPFPGAGKQPHTVAHIKIETNVFGAKGVTHLKVAFVKPGDEGGGGPGGPGGGPIRPGRPFPGQQQFVPAEDQEGLFFLQKHPTSANHYVIPFGQTPVLSADAKYKGEVEAVKGLAAAFADPVKALTAEKEEDRIAHALAIAQKYRQYPPNNPTGVTDETPIPADETKLLLKVLTDLDWTKHADAPRLADALGLMPGNYGIPRVKAGDGEEPLAVRQKALKAWVEKHGAKFEVKKVTAKAVDKQSPTKPIGPAK
jgi:hypothetical protein